MRAAADLSLPSGLSEAIVALTNLFASRENHDIGGWAVPYLLTQDCVEFCSYAYSVSDRISSSISSSRVQFYLMAPRKVEAPRSP